MLPVTCIFDVGKTNKKVFLFDDQYNIVHERSVQLPETVDEDGFPCEDIFLLTNWVKETFRSILLDNDYTVKAVNVSAYGASFVLVDEKGDPVGPLYNYLKPYPVDLQDAFYLKYGGRENFAVDTSSPCLGNLNSGLQLYRVKNCLPSMWAKTRYALHLPQYIASLISGNFHAEMTSIGCHTALWNFRCEDYHDWVYEEGIHSRFPAIVMADHKIKVKGMVAGPGLHDSSAALIPYLSCFKEPFMLLSTGTWNISLNPFNHYPLTGKELEQDCLCYYRHDGLPVKASRLFAGNEHELEIKKLCDKYEVDPGYFSRLDYEPAYTSSDKVPDREYHLFMKGLVDRQVRAANLVLQNDDVKTIYVDGGFARNKVFMHLFASAYPGMKVYAAIIGQASAIGAAMMMNDPAVIQPGRWMETQCYSNA